MVRGKMSQVEGGAGRKQGTPLQRGARKSFLGGRQWKKQQPTRGLGGPLHMVLNFSADNETMIQ